MNGSKKIAGESPAAKKRTKENFFSRRAAMTRASEFCATSTRLARLLASLFFANSGSSGGLAAVRDGVADVALSHLLDPETGEYNLPFVRRTISSGVALVPLFHRELGLLLGAGNPLGLRTLADLGRSGVRMINRQAGSGTRHYTDQQFSKLGIDAKKIKGYDDAVEHSFRSRLAYSKSRRPTWASLRARPLGCWASTSFLSPGSDSTS